jgi:hypothetical protein
VASLSIVLACRGQGVAPAAANNASHPVPTTPAQESSEKAEDASLLQQLEADTQQTRSEGRGKSFFPSTAAPRGAGPSAQVFGGGTSYRLVTRPAANSRALIVRTSDSDPKSQVALEEDLGVMSHLLNKALEDLPGGPGHGNKVLGIDVFFTPGSEPLRTLYLDNYGALFFLNVNFPLLAPTEKRAAEEKPAGGTAWEEAWQELYGQRSAGAMGEPAEDYNPEKVEKLKDTLFEALKNATNIRGLKPDEFVTIWVCGGSRAGNGRFKAVKGKEGAAVITADHLISTAKRTILTIRARKTDIDQYAKGKIGADDFRKRVLQTAYTGDAAVAADNLTLSGFGGGRAGF